MSTEAKRWEFLERSKKALAPHFNEYEGLSGILLVAEWSDGKLCSAYGGSKAAPSKRAMLEKKIFICEREIELCRKALKDEPVPS